MWLKALVFEGFFRYTMLASAPRDNNLAAPTSRSEDSYSIDDIAMRLAAPASR
jgi:hypothetical protein